MLKSLTFNRLINYIQLKSSYLLSRLTGSLVLWGKLVSLSIEISGTCQLHCPECPLGSGKNPGRSFMSQELFESIIRENKNHLWMVSLYFQGEPLLHPQIDAFIRLLKKHRIYTSVATNGNTDKAELAENIVKAGLDELIVSIDGATEESYQQYRKGGSLKKVLGFIQQVQDAKTKAGRKKPRLIMQSIISRHNEDEIPDLKRLANELSVKFRLKSMQINDLETPSDLPKNPDLRRYHLNGNKARIKNPHRNHCWRLYRNPVITSEGDVLPCCFDKALTHKTGNLSQGSFASIWNSTAYRNFRKKVFSDRKNTDICTNCSEGTRDIYV
jgi:radical SAM protein with 4Fe4S-binding SPASM domain